MVWRIVGLFQEVTARIECLQFTWWKESKWLFINWNLYLNESTFSKKLKNSYDKYSALLIAVSNLRGVFHDS